MILDSYTGFVKTVLLQYDSQDSLEEQQLLAVGYQ